MRFLNRQAAGEGLRDTGPAVALVGEDMRLDENRRKELARTYGDRASFGLFVAGRGQEAAAEEGGVMDPGQTEERANRAAARAIRAALTALREMGAATCGR
jgi:hypothetical protein